MIKEGYGPAILKPLFTKSHPDGVPGANGGVHADALRAVAVLDAALEITEAALANGKSILFETPVSQAADSPYPPNVTKKGHTKTKIRTPGIEPGTIRYLMQLQSNALPTELCPVCWKFLKSYITDILSNFRCIYHILK